MADTVFDPTTFLNTEVKGAIDTTIIPVPQGEYRAQINRPPRFRKIDTKDGERVVMDVTWEIDDDGVKKTTKLDHPIARQSVFIDLTEEGGIDMTKGKNRQLGLLREAVGQNDARRQWAPSMLEGAMAKVKVEHSENPNDAAAPYANVTRVAAA